jgi:hypothetical protein
MLRFVFKTMRVVFLEPSVLIDEGHLVGGEVAKTGSSQRFKQWAIPDVSCCLEFDWLHTNIRTRLPNNYASDDEAKFTCQMTWQQYSVGRNKKN